MGAFRDTLSPTQVDAIRAYVIDESRKAYADQQAGKKPFGG
jgi:hypothetical protein